MNKDNAREEVKLLLEKYDRIIQKERDIKSKEEEMTKKDLIRPLFERVLGWNFEEDVTAEEKISKGWVDYGFRINDVPKFFLEAKALREDLDNQKFFEQAVNYAYYKRCPWAVLTNFETVKILNAEWETPYYFSSHFMTIKCNEFVDRFEDLWLLPKESFEQGLLDKLAEKYGKKTKKASVDKQLLNDFTKFRDMLSKNVTKLNQSKKLTQAELDESIQRVLDRLIFIRNCEDRGLEEKKLWEARNETKVWKKLKEVFAYYDKHYDSKLFTFDLTDLKKVHLCDTLDIDDSVMRELIECLYRTKDQSISYDFSIIDADVLGTVYEQYLSHILKKTEKRATLTENHIHKKEQGIYYTPTYVVDYIVRSTLGELLKKESIDAERIKVLDPACGSGSFLIKAFDVFNEQYRKNDENYSQTQLDLETGTTFTRKVKILQNNIFGVDLDKQAVEIAQLNLLLKIAEKSSRLPILEQNIKCGNSLIDDENVAGEKAFKWKEQFKEIIDKGGFDVIIGNPPYGASFSNNEKDFIKKAFKSATGRYDSYYYFIERSVRLLVDGGFLGFITPDTWLTNHQTKDLRDLILSTCSIIKIIGLPQAVFAEANVDTCIIILQKEPNDAVRRKNTVAVSILGKDARLGNLLQNVFESEFKAIQNDWMTDERCLFNIYQSRNVLVDKIKVGCVSLGDISEMCRGINPYAKSELIKKYGEVKGTEIVENRIWHSDTKKGSEYKKELVGSDIGRYWANWQSGKWVKYGDWLSRPRDPKFFTLPHLVVQRIRNPKLKTRIVSTFIDPIDEYYNNSGLTNIIVKEGYSVEYVLAILNSKLMNWFYRQFFRDVNIKPEDLRGLPIKKISVIEQRTSVGLVEKMLSLNKRLNEIGGKRTDEYSKIENEIKKTDSEIDEQVYQIYGLTEDEKKTIEDSFK